MRPHYHSRAILLQELSHPCDCTCTAASVQLLKCLVHASQQCLPSHSLRCMSLLANGSGEDPGSRTAPHPAILKEEGAEEGLASKTTGIQIWQELASRPEGLFATCSSPPPEALKIWPYAQRPVVTLAAAVCPLSLPPFSSSLPALSPLFSLLLFNPIGCGFIHSLHFSATHSLKIQDSIQAPPVYPHNHL